MLVLTHTFKAFSSFNETGGLYSNFKDWIVPLLQGVYTVESQVVVYAAIIALIVTGLVISLYSKRPDKRGEAYGMLSSNILTIFFLFGIIAIVAAIFTLQLKK